MPWKLLAYLLFIASASASSGEVSHLRRWHVVSKDQKVPLSLLDIVQVPQLAGWPFPSFWPPPQVIPGDVPQESPLISGGHMDSGPGEEPCQWPGTTQCSDVYEPICVTDFSCIYALNNDCWLRQMNCACQRYHILESKFCDDFRSPKYRRCNLKVYLQW